MLHAFNTAMALPFNRVHTEFSQESSRSNDKKKMEIQGRINLQTLER